jgi:hypothetical protein
MFEECESAPAALAGPGFASPKSSSFARPLEIMMLPGFRSR